MNNEQLTKAVEELAKNQLEIIEAVDKVAKKVKKLKKAQKVDYDLNNFFGDPVSQLHNIKFKQAGDKVVNEVERPKEDQKHYLCINDLNDIKEGTILKFNGLDDCINYNTYTYKAPCGFIETVSFIDIAEYKDYFIPIQQFETLKEGQEIEFTLRNGKTYKSEVVKNTYDKYTLNLWRYECQFKDLNQIDFKNTLLEKYVNRTWVTTETLEELTKVLNTLITLPDLSVKQPEIFKDETYLIQANELIEHFMPLVNGWVKCQPFAEGSKIFEHEGSGHIDQSFWKWNIVNYRKAAIMCAIKHCELNDEVIKFQSNRNNEAIKLQLEKMLAE